MDTEIEHEFVLLFRRNARSRWEIVGTAATFPEASALAAHGSGDYFTTTRSKAERLLQAKPRRPAQARS